MTILRVNNLTVTFPTQKGKVTAVDKVSFELKKGKTLALVGESGSGKSVTATSLLRLQSGRIEEGEICFFDGGKEEYLQTWSNARMRTLRGNRISMIFQEPMTCLNPVMTVKKQLMEPFLLHARQSRKQAAASALDALSAVGIADRERVAKGYPHQLSGGMRQRVMIAMALAADPAVLIADEPTTALDVTLQAQILRLIGDMQKKLGTAVLFITHDLGVVKEIADEVAVMYCGKIVEKCSAKKLFSSARHIHPYTQGLLDSLPLLTGKKELHPIRGTAPNLAKLPKGCNFSTRCDACRRRCTEEEPLLKEVEKGRWIACHYPNKEGRRGREEGTV